MRAKRIMMAAASVTALAVGAGAALAQDDDYGPYGRYDDQAEETRRLNLLQLQNPGAGMAAVPQPAGTVSYYDDGMGGRELSGPPSPEDDDDFDDDDEETGDDEDTDPGLGDDDDDDDAELGDDDEPGAMGDDDTPY